MVEHGERWKYSSPYEPSFGTLSSADQISYLVTIKLQTLYLMQKQASNKLFQFCKNNILDYFKTEIGS